jgi:hypothetical protein
MGLALLTAPEAKLGVPLATLDGRRPLNALRHSLEGDTCGWYIWAGKQMPSEDDAFSPIHADHLEQLCPQIIPYLGLLPGWRVLLALTHVDIWYDASLLKS